ncbi:MAG: methylglyoxal synthase [Calditrichaeota bacterium]|nr:methylglyoxal synthase [Calditrichota bacterium]MCB9369046.1 methylglyoxal synthase [Calditrichota bacterium]
MNIALIAHDAKKSDMAEWADYNRLTLSEHSLYATGTTGEVVSNATGLLIHRMRSGPLGGDQQIGAMIAEGKVDVLIFFWDPMDTHPHDPDVKALLRLSVLYDIPTACNKRTADFLISSLLWHQLGDQGGIN